MKPLVSRTCIAIVALLLFLLTDACRIRVHERPRHVKKPVIYLYPQDTLTVSVKLNTVMSLTTTAPAYNGEWNVVASPNGTLQNIADGKFYPYLFWEATDDYEYRLDSGYCVRGDSSEHFLRRILPQIGLNPTETDEFISYWVPELEKNKYNVITFAGEEYQSRAKLEITPEPNSVLRVFMVFKHTELPVKLPEQTFTPFVREGFTVVEWGGVDMSDENNNL